MEGRTISHYRVVERLGGGGMGIVYKAIDERLDRAVALKFLPPELTRDDDARYRLIQEAKAASALDHPNICTVHDIDATPEGQLFIAMSFYGGETLKKRMSRGPLTVQDTLDIASQVAQGLAKAHAAGIIHRDIKPANLMITKDGIVKIVDFGVAKVADQTSSTQSGTSLGTIAYMSPEQINAQAVAEETDIWSLGATMYEMLAGQRPFAGEHPLVLMKEIANSDPVDLGSLRGDVPEALANIVAGTLSKRREDRPTAANLAQRLIECRTALSMSPAGRDSLSRLLTRPKVMTAAALVTLVVAGLVGWSLNRAANTRWAREQIAEISRLVEQDQYAAAFALAEQVEPYASDDPALRSLWPRFSRIVDIETEPAGARVSTRSYSDPSDPWRDLGVSPLSSVRVPVGLRRWRFTKEGARSLELALPITSTLKITLDTTGDETEVAVPGGAVSSWITGIDPIERIQLPSFRIDKYEVTNRQYKAFIQAGGYRTNDHWDQPFVVGGKSVGWQEAVTRFVDATGRPGPATWELGDYPAGQDDYPVTGVSWYEAAAYAKFAGKSLPTVSNWIQAAGTGFAAAIAPLSNLQGSAPAAVGRYQGLGPFGTYDMAGNVREWCWNAWGDSRYILGAAWPDPQYMFTYANIQSPFDRSATNGIRLARYAGEMPAAAAKPVELLARDYAKETPVTDEVFNVYRNRFSYDPASLTAKAEPAPAATSDFRVEKVSFTAAYGKEVMTVYLYLPTTGAPPYQTVVMFPGSSAIGTPTPSPEAAVFVPKSGRALVIPVYRGTWERRDGLPSTWPNESRRYSEYVVSWVQDFKRTLEYLETRGDIDMTKLAYFGFSWGARLGAIIPAVEPRIKTAILIAGGLASGKAQPEVDQINFITRVRQPVLMLNGRYDAIEPVETAQRPMFELLGTPKEHKKWMVYDDDHALPARRNEVARESLAWLDRYLAPVH